jgi:hypothetical protein
VKIILKVVGLSQTTIFAEISFEDLCDKIESTVIKSNHREYNSILVLSRGNNRQPIINDKRQLFNSKLQYCMNDDTLVRLYCACDDGGLKQLPNIHCSKSRLICLTYRRARTFGYGEHEPASWQILGSIETRTSFIEKMSKQSNDILHTVQIYFPYGKLRRESVPWRSPVPDVARPLDSIILNGDLRDTVMQSIQNFIDRKGRYTDGGHRHVLGLFFYGPAGTGKSTLVYGIAAKFNFGVYIFSLGDSDLTDEHLMIMCNAMRSNSIALLEDLDKVEMGGKGVTMSGILALLDGIAAKTRITIITANDRAKISPIVLRKGRIDDEHYFSLATKSQGKEMFLNMNLWTAEETKDSNLNDMAERFARGLTDNPIPPANIAVYIKSCKTPEDAIKRLPELTVESKSAVKKKGESSVNRFLTALMEQG